MNRMRDLSLKIKAFCLLLFVAIALLPDATYAKNSGVSGLSSRQFDKFWRIESESPDYKLSFSGDTTEIVAPKGLTLWRKEKMTGDVVIEFDACVYMTSDKDRLSDLNCFWMASDPKNPDNLWKRSGWRNGTFEKYYSLQLYYMGYGGNHNTTTRFRRYTGNEDGIEDVDKRPAILAEYTDSENLLQPNHWYHIRLSCHRGQVCYSIDGKTLVDYRDPEALTEGWFGFRTTASHVGITNFRCFTPEEPFSRGVPLKWVGSTPKLDRPVSFGVPFDPGEIMAETIVKLKTENDSVISTDSWPLAFWPDKSVKWLGVAGVVPGGTDILYLEKISGKNKKKEKGTSSRLAVNEDLEKVYISTGVAEAWIPRNGDILIDSISFDGVKVGENCRLVSLTQNTPVLENTESVSFSKGQSRIQSVEVEREGDVRATVKLTGVHRETEGKEWLPFIIRLYFYAGSEEIRMVHSFIYDGDQDHDFIKGLGIRLDVPLRNELYNRHVAFSGADGGIWSEPVQPLVGRRNLSHPSADGDGSSKPDRLIMQRKQMQGERIPPYESFDEANQSLLDNWASWDSYRLSQLTPDGFTIRKRANDNNPWIGTFSDTRSDGYAFVGDCDGGMGLWMQDFWQSYPSSMEISGAKSDMATITAWLWSPEGEPMDLRHYDNIAHDLNASYEDVQEGMSTPYGIARTSTLILLPQGGYAGKEDVSARSTALCENSPLLPTPEYLHAKQAFGVWSLPDRTTPFRSQVEDVLQGYTDFYKKAVDEHKWYGFWNYGDFMHAYDPVRHEWRYDVGGFAWDNTELASNLWLWYSFLRTGDPSLWKLAEAMTRHTAEVDVYHLGPNEGLGSRHNVSHWGCGAKEARISQAVWNRCYYYLTTDERCGDLMTEVRDVDYKLYTLDPMRLAQPRDLYPCTAPARLRIGPDWLAYVGNWMTEWERTGNTSYRDKIITGMKSIEALPSRIFTGPLALGYDPATGVITTECDSTLQTTNHLMSIMGGFEMMNELGRMIDRPEWNDTWLDYTANYKQKALDILHNRFRISRLLGYAASKMRDPKIAEEAWSELMRDAVLKDPMVEICPPEVPAPRLEYKNVSTNDAAMWSLDAIYLQEVIPKNDF